MVLSISIVNASLASLIRESPPGPVSDILQTALGLSSVLRNVDENKHTWSLLANMSYGILTALVQSGPNNPALIESLARLQAIHRQALGYANKLQTDPKIEKVLEGAGIRQTIQRFSKDLDVVWIAITQALRLQTTHGPNDQEFNVARDQDVAEENALIAYVSQLLQQSDVAALRELDIRLDMPEWQIRQVTDSLLNRTDNEDVPKQLLDNLIAPLLQLLQSQSTVARSMKKEIWRIPPSAITGRSPQPIARGGFGEVYTASYYGSDVAIKQLFATYSEKEIVEFRREISIWHRLNHSNILPLRGACDTTDRPFMISPFMPNGTLHAYISDPDNVRPVGERLKLMYQVASGMAYLHANGIIHGDLKTLNVLLDEAFRAVISDFGMSRTKHTSSTARRAPVTQTPGGTVEYMAPEMLDDEDPSGTTRKTDVYAFGIMLYQVMKNGRTIWETKDGQPMNQTAIGVHVCMGRRPKPVDGIPEEIWTLIQQCWHNDPAQRPRFTDILSSLQQYRDFAGQHRPTVHRPPSINPIPPPMDRQNLSLAASIVPSHNGSQTVLKHEPSTQGIRSIYGAATITPELAWGEPSVSRRSFGTASSYSDEQNYRPGAAGAPSVVGSSLNSGFQEDHKLAFYLNTKPGGVSHDLYQRLFTRIFSNSHHPDELCIVISAIATAKWAITPRVISEIFAIPPVTVLKCVDELKNLLDPGRNDPKASADGFSQIHWTIVEYLTSNDSLEEPFHVSDTFHMDFAKGCLNRILAFEPVANICGIYDFHEKIRDLGDRAREKITESLRYSVANWIPHFAWALDPKRISAQTWPRYQQLGLANEYTGEVLHQVGAEDSLLSRLLLTHVFFWLECASLTGVFKSVVAQVSLLRGIITRAPTTVVDDITRTLVSDTYRFVREFADAIIKSAPQVYNSGFAFTPKESLLYKTYAPRLEDKIPFLVASGTALNWNPCLLTTSILNNDGVQAVALSPDEKWIAYASRDDVYIREIDTGKVKKLPQSHTHYVRAVAISPDGNSIVSGSVDNLVKVWDAAAGKLRLTLKGHSDTVHSVAVSVDGRLIVSGSDDKTAKIWDISTGQLRFTLHGYKNYVNAIAISPSSKWVVTGSGRDPEAIKKLFVKHEAFPVKIWNAENGQQVVALEKHNGTVTAVAFSPDETLVASGSKDKTVRVWNAATGEEMLVLEGHTGAVLSVGFSPCNSWIISGSSDSTIKIWNAATGQLRQTLVGHKDEIISLAISSEGNLVVSASKDKDIKFWDISAYMLGGFAEVKPSILTAVSLAPNGITAATGSYDGSVLVWESRTLERRQILRGHTDWVRSISISNDGKTITSTDSRDRTIIWVYVDGRFVRSDRQAYSAPSIVSPQDELAWTELSPGSEWIKHGKHLIKIPKELFDPIRRNLSKLVAMNAVESNLHDARGAYRTTIIYPIYLNNIQIHLALKAYRDSFPGRFARGPGQ